MIRQILPFVAIGTLLVVTTVNCDDAAPIPPNQAQVSSWFQANVKPFSARKGTLDAALQASEAAPTTIKVRKDGSGDFKTVTDAINSIPSGNKKRVVVDIGPGDYVEKITIERDKPFVTLFGSSGNPSLSFAGDAKKYGTVYSATLQVEADYFVAANLVIRNTSPRPDGKTMVGAQAVAFRIAGDMAAMYNCRFIGFQDTVCDDRGRHFFKDCLIEGTVDFIFGSGRSLYVGTNLNVLADKAAVITAQAKHTRQEVSGFSFVHSKITGTGSGGLLGRAWMEMPEVVFAYSTMSSVIAPEGWSNDNHPEREKNIIFGEYKNTGPGATPNKRVKFSKQLTDAEVKPFLNLGYVEGSSWLLPPP